METGDGPMTRGDFAYGEVDMDLEIADAAGIVDSYYDWQVPTYIPTRKCTTFKRGKISP